MLFVFSNIGLSMGQCVLEGITLAYEISFRTSLSMLEGITLAFVVALITSTLFVVARNQVVRGL